MVDSTSAPERVHPSGAVYAGWWQRAGAQTIDSLIFLPIVVTILVLWDGAGGLALLATVFSNSLVFAYDTVLDGGPHGQTIGRRLAGIRVIADDTGGRLGYRRAFGRSVFTAALGFVGRFSSGLGVLLLLVDHLWPLFDSRRQTWHDKAVGSVVVRA